MSEKIHKNLQQQYCNNNQYPIIEKKRRIVAIGDIHGDLHLLITILVKSNLIKIVDKRIEWIGSDTYIVQVGDLIDAKVRANIKKKLNISSHSHANVNTNSTSTFGYTKKIFKLIKLLNIKAQRFGGAFMFVIGNHELFNVLGFTDYISQGEADEFKNYVDSNGKLFKNGLDARLHAFRPGNEYAKILACNGHGMIIIGTNLFVHAGLVDEYLNSLTVDSREKSSERIIMNRDNIMKFNVVVKKFLLNLISQDNFTDFVKLYDMDISPFMTRRLGQIPKNLSYDNPVCKKNIDGVFNKLGINNIIIGHTPQFIYGDGINSTCDNKIWRIDVGSSHAFDTSTYVKNRGPQILEIINDNIFHTIVL